MHMQVCDFLGLSVLIKIHGISGQFLDKSLTSSISNLTCPAMATLGNYCSYLLYICIDERMKAPLSENEMKFKNIQKMRE